MTATGMRAKDKPGTAWLLLGLFLMGAVRLSATSFYTVPPCRIVDTRGPAGSFGAPDLTPGGSRSFAIAGQCGISTAAEAVAVNVTVVAPPSPGHLTFAPLGGPQPSTSTINFRPGRCAPTTRSCRWARPAV